MNIEKQEKVEEEDVALNEKIVQYVDISELDVNVVQDGLIEIKEIEQAENKGGKTISLGSRILRTETAAIASVTMCMLYAEMELGDFDE